MPHTIPSAVLFGCRFAPAFGCEGRLWLRSEASIHHLRERHPDIHTPFGVKQRNRVQQADTSLLHQIIYINSNIIFIRSHASVLFHRYFSDEAQITFQQNDAGSRIPFLCQLAQLLIALGRHFSAPARGLRWIDMKNSIVVYPKDIQKSYDKVVRRFKQKKDSQIKREFIAVYQQLSGQLDFERDGFKIVYPSTPDDVIAEGHVLHHCVGSYTERVAEKECIILFLRKCSDETKPFYTVEVRGQKAVQVQGKRNCDMTPEVEAFITVWEQRVLSTRHLAAAA